MAERLVDNVFGRIGEEASVTYFEAFWDCGKLQKSSVKITRVPAETGTSIHLVQI
jgi:hypothetical protein